MCYRMALIVVLTISANAGCVYPLIAGEQRVASKPPKLATQGISTEDLDDYAAQLRRNRVSCGPLSLWHCLRRLGHSVDQQQLVAEAPIKNDGMNLNELLSLAERNALPGEAIEFHAKDFGLLTVPAILVVGGEHCLAYDGLDQEGFAQVFDPTTRSMRKLPVDTLRRTWTGTAIVFSGPQLSRYSFWRLSTSVALITFAIAGICAFRRIHLRPIAPQ